MSRRRCCRQRCASIRWVGHRSFVKEGDEKSEQASKLFEHNLSYALRDHDAGENNREGHGRWERGEGCAGKEAPPNGARWRWCQGEGASRQPEQVSRSYCCTQRCTQRAHCEVCHKPEGGIRPRRLNTRPIFHSLSDAKSALSLPAPQELATPVITIEHR